MPSLIEVREELNAKRRSLHEVWSQAGPDRDFERVTLLGPGDTQQKIAELRRRDAEINALAYAEQELAFAEMIATKNETELERLNAPRDGMHFPGGEGQKSIDPRRLKETLREDKNYKAFREGQARSVTLDLPGLDFKTLVTLSTINAQATRQDPVAMALEERTVADLMLSSTTMANTIEYYEETTYTNNAAAVDEGGTKPESAEGWTLRTENVRKYAHFIPATAESLADVGFLEGQLRGRLAFGITRAEETALLTGSGTAPNLRGLLNRTGIQTQAKGADPTPDAIYKAMNLVRGAAGSGFAEPTAIIMHPLDFQEVKLLRTATEGIYIYGGPADPGPDRMWGLPVRQTTAMTQNTALVGAFRPHAEVIRREGITITLSTEHSTYFIENKVAILAESRLALAVYRPSAFATVTGI